MKVLHIFQYVAEGKAMNGKKKQIEYSKQEICQALFQLLKTNSFGEITVNEILDLSQISRRTFYRYFSNKDQVLDYYFEGLISHYQLLEDRILAQETFKGMLTVTLDFFLSHKENLVLLIRDGQFHLLLEKFNRASLAIYQKINAPWHVTNRNSLDDTLRFIVGGYFNIISSWLMEKEPRSADEIAQHLQELFQTIGNHFPKKKEAKNNE